VTCFSTYAEEVAFWNNTVVFSINETISTNFTDPGELLEFYSHVPETDAKLEEFGQRCSGSEGGPYLKYVGTSSTIRDLVLLANKIVGPEEPINFYGYGLGTAVGLYFLPSESVDPSVLGWVVDVDSDPNLSVSRCELFIAQNPRFHVQVLTFPEARRQIYPRRTY